MTTNAADAEPDLDRPDHLVQAIVVTPGTHQDTVVAAALASALCLHTTRDDPRWATWVDLAIAKTVRRARTDGLFTKAVDAADHGPVVICGTARAVAFLPEYTSLLPHPIRRLQVGGLDCDRGGRWPTDNGGLTVIVNSNAAMTTGKTAAQVAHCLTVWLLETAPEVVSVWLQQPTWTIREQRVLLPPAGAVVIRDAGHTEVPSGTITAYLTGTA